MGPGEDEVGVPTRVLVTSRPPSRHLLAGGVLRRLAPQQRGPASLGLLPDSEGIQGTSTAFPVTVPTQRRHACPSAL